MKAAINISHPPVAESAPRRISADPEFVKEMTHELHTPLNVIIGLCQLLERDRRMSLSPLQHDAIGRMDRNAHALLKTIDQLLNCLRSDQLE